MFRAVFRFSLVLGLMVILCWPMSEPLTRTAAQEKAPTAKQPQDPLPLNAIVRLGTSRLRHAAQIGQLQFSPSGKVLASSSLDGSVALWDAKTGKELWRIGESRGSEHNWLAHSPIDFAPDGKSLIVGTWISRLTTRRWSLPRIHFVNVEDGKVGRKLWDGELAVFSLAISPDGKTLVATDEKNGVLVWDVPGNRERFALKLPQLPKNEYNSSKKTLVCISGDGKSLVFADGDWHKPSGDITLYDLQSSGTTKATLSVGKEASIESLFRMPDGDLLGVHTRNTVQIWQLSSREIIRTLKLDKEDRRVAVSANKLLAVGNWADSCVRLIDLDIEKERLRLPGFPSALAFSSDGRLLATGNDHAVRIWDTKTGRPVVEIEGPSNSAKCLAFSEDGNVLVAGENGGHVRLWDVSKGAELGVKRLRTGWGDYGGFGAVRWTQGQALATPNSTPFGEAGASKEPIVWDAQTGKALLSIDPFVSKGGYVFPVALSPDGKTAVVGWQSEVLLMDVATGKERFRLKVKDAEGMHGARFSANGRRLLTHSSGAKSQRRVTVWDVASSKELASISDPELREGTLSPDGKIVAAQIQYSCVFFDADTGKKLRQTKNHHTFNNLAFSSDGTVLASSDYYGKIQLWDVESATELLTLDGHRGGIRDLVFDRLQRLASSGHDTTILLWDLALATGGDKELAPAPKQLENAWSDLAGDDLRARCWANLVFRRETKQTTAFLAKHFRPIPTVDAKRLKKLFDDLDDDSFEVREKASAELLGSVEAVEEELRLALKSNNALEFQHRVKRILATIRFAPVARERRALVAVRILEEIGSKEARALLEAHSRGRATAPQSKAALAALKRLEGQ